MSKLDSPSLRRMALLIDGALIFALLWPTPACSCIPHPEYSLAYTELSTGRVMRDVALAQERYHQAHALYADRAADLELPMPGWEIAVLDASPTDYRMRVSTAEHTCVLWHRRVESTDAERFFVNCGLDIATLGASRDRTTAPPN